MNLHSLLIFLHVLGSAGLFAALGIEAVGITQLRRARKPGDVNMVMGILRVPARAGGLSTLVVLVTGIWMQAKWWGHQPWIASAMLAIVAMVVVGASISRRNARGLADALARETGHELSSSFRSARAPRLLMASFAARLTIMVGIVALMTMKPRTGGSVVILALVAVAATLTAVGLYLGSSKQTGGRAANLEA